MVFLFLPRFCTQKMAAPRDDYPEEAVNILWPFAMPLRSLSDQVLHSLSSLARHACKRGISHDKKKYTPKPSWKYHLGGLSIERWRKHILSHFHKTIMPSQWNIGANSLMWLWSWLICAGDCQSRVHFLKCWILDKEELHPFNKCLQQFHLI